MQHNVALGAVFDCTFETCRHALKELEAREAQARATGASLAHLVAQLDPETARLTIATRDAFRARCKTASGRALVAHSDAPDVMRVVMVDGKGSGRSVTVPELERVLTYLEGAAAHGR